MTATSLLLPLTVCAALALGDCHRTAAPMDVSSSRGLTVERYDVQIPKAPLQGPKLETMSLRPNAPTKPSSASVDSGDALSTGTER